MTVNRKPPNAGRMLLWAAIAPLLLVSAVYLGRGYYHLLLDSSDFRVSHTGTFVPNPVDLRFRWVEQHYILRRKNPYPVYFRWVDERRSPTTEPQPAKRPKVERDDSVEPDLDVPVGAGYPPWAYFTGVAFFWPSNWTAARYYFAVFNLASLAAIGVWAYRSGASQGRDTGMLLLAAVFAISGNTNTLKVGQYSLIVLACLIATFWFDRHKRPVLCGFALAVALTKPNIALPFLLPLLVKRRWLALATAGAYLAVGSCFTWWLTGTDPICMLRQMRESMALWGMDTGGDPVSVLSAWGVPAAWATNVVAAVVLSASLLLMVIWRRAPMSTLFVIAAAASRFWTYHRPYDNVILAFLLLALGVEALQSRRKLAVATFAIVGVTLWVPARLTLNSLVDLRPVMLLIWLASLVVFITLASRRDPTGDREQFA